MAIHPANKPYDPSKNKPGATGNTEGGLPYRDHDDGPYTYVLNRPPKPGISFGLLAWVVLGATITFAVIVTAVIALWP